MRREPLVEWTVQKLYSDMENAARRTDLLFSCLMRYWAQDEVLFDLYPTGFRAFSGLWAQGRISQNCSPWIFGASVMIGYRDCFLELRLLHLQISRRTNQTNHLVCPKASNRAKSRGEQIKKKQVVCPDTSNRAKV